MTSQTVVMGPKFLEHRYTRFDDYFVGTWKFYGSKVEINPANEKVVCESCRANYDQRREDDKRLISNSSDPVIRSYQIPGETDSSVCYDWDRCLCSNESCWGKSEYYLEVRRKFLYKEPGVMQFMFKQTKRRGNSSQSDIMYIKVKSEESEFDRMAYSGVGHKSQIPKLFWPGLFKDEKPGHWYYVFMTIRGKILEPDFLHKNLRPYKFPTQIDLTFYRENPGHPMASTFEDLKNHKVIAKCCWDVYPGGAGCRMKQWKVVENTPSTPVWLTAQSCKSGSDANRLLYGDLSDPHWVEKDLDYISKDEAFVPGFRTGYSGPITSFFTRVDNNHRSF